MTNTKSIQTAAIYARVSTADQTCDLQLRDLREYCERRGWQAVEYVDTGVSGAKASRERLDRMMLDARRGKVDVVVCWRFDRFARSTKHLLEALEEFKPHRGGRVDRLLMTYEADAKRNLDVRHVAVCIFYT